MNEGNRRDPRLERLEEQTREVVFGVRKVRQEISHPEDEANELIETIQEAVEHTEKEAGPPPPGA